MVVWRSAFSRFSIMHAHCRRYDAGYNPRYRLRRRLDGRNVQRTAPRGTHPPARGSRSRPQMGAFPPGLRNIPHGDGGNRPGPRKERAKTVETDARALAHRLRAEVVSTSRSNRHGTQAVRNYVPSGSHGAAARGRVGHRRPVRADASQASIDTRAPDGGSGVVHAEKK